MFNKKSYLIIGIVAVLLIAGLAFAYYGLGIFDKDKTLSLLDEWKVCVQDTDCAETQANCCNCGHGGVQTGINKQYLKHWQDILKKKCRDIDCIALFNCKEGKAVCENNKCEFKEDAESISPNLTEEDMNLNISDWQTYRNEEFGFEVKYPSDWFIKQDISEVNPLLNIKKDNKYYINIWVHSAFTGVGLNAIKISESAEKIAGLDAVKEFYKTIDNEQYYRILLRTNKFHYTIEYSNYDEALFDQILSTFKFLKGPDNGVSGLDLLPAQKFVIQNAIAALEKRDINTFLLYVPAYEQDSMKTALNMFSQAAFDELVNTIKNATVINKTEKYVELETVMDLPGGIKQPVTFEMVIESGFWKIGGF